MFDQTGTIDIFCDAPAYEIVQACRVLGFCNPEDVRWSRLICFAETAEKSRWKKFIQRTWEVFLGKQKQPMTCSCGEPLPLLEEHVFLLHGGMPMVYLIGQCQICHTIYWDDLPPVSLL